MMDFEQQRQQEIEVANRKLTQLDGWLKRRLKSITDGKARAVMVEPIINDSGAYPLTDYSISNGRLMLKYGGGALHIDPVEVAFMQIARSVVTFLSDSERGRIFVSRH